MQRRKWEPKTKALIVLQGLRGKPVAELCTEHQISQAQFYPWRDQFLAKFSIAPERYIPRLALLNVHLIR